MSITSTKITIQQLSFQRPQAYRSAQETAICPNPPVSCFTGDGKEA